jgi:hypothetical protein
MREWGSVEEGWRGKSFENVLPAEGHRGREVRRSVFKIPPFPPSPSLSLSRLPILFEHREGVVTQSLPSSTLFVSFEPFPTR